MSPETPNYPLLRRFLSDLGEPERSRILTVPQRRAAGIEELTYNVIEIQLDFDSRTASVYDVLDATITETLPLKEFLEAVDSGSVPT